MTELEKKIREKEKENMTDKEKRYYDLLEHIVKGANFIDSISPEDKRYMAAIRKYDKYCGQALKLRRYA